jgi:hypothetical protein
MARKCFYSFEYKPDCWRASKIRNIGVIEGNQTVSDNDWEKITWNDKKGVLGIYIHNITNAQNMQSGKGKNPFQSITVSERSMADIVKTYDPPYAPSDMVYDYISKNIESWVDEAIKIRNQNYMTLISPTAANRKAIAGRASNKSFHRQTARGDAPLVR